MCTTMENYFKKWRIRRMNWTNLWIKLFGTTALFGLNIGFWVAMAVVVLIVILMNVVFWNMKPKIHNH